MSGNLINAEKVNEQIPFEKIESIHGRSRITADFSSYVMDESKLAGVADSLFFPQSESEIVTILNFFQINKVRASISAARTGIVGSCVPSGGSVLSIEKMNEILGFGFDKHKESYFMRVQPGVTLDAINEFLKKKEFSNVIEITPNAIKIFQESNQTLYYPVDPTEMSATIGGTVATNASGAGTLKYGPTRNWIKGLRIALSSGDILNLQRGDVNASNEGVFIINQTNGKELRFRIPNYIFNTSVKNAAGIYSKPEMDIIDLFIGSEGILGIITQIDIWLIEKKPIIHNILFFKSEEDAINFAELLRSNSIIDPEFIEFFSLEALNLLKKLQGEAPSSINMPLIPVNAKSAIFFDFPYSDDRMDTIFNELNKLTEGCNTDLSDGWSGYEDQDFARFKQFRHSLPENINAIIASRKQQFPLLHKLGTDMTVPDKYFRSMMEYYHSKLRNAKLEYVIFGHIGDNHVHVNILPKNMEELQIGEQIYEKFALKAVEYGGSISGEHGIGKIKREYLKFMYSQKDLDEMRLIKKSLDPGLILNYGNIISFD